MKCNLKRIVTGNDVAIRMVRNRTVQSPQPVVFSCRFLAASTVGDIEKWVYDDDDHYHDRTDDSLTWAQKNDDRREIARLSARSLVSIIWLIKARWFSFELFLKLYQVTLILLENYRAFFSFQSLKINFNPLRTLSFSHLNPFYLVRRNNHRKKICFANFCNFYLRVFFFEFALCKTIKTSTNTLWKSWKDKQCYSLSKTSLQEQSWLQTFYKKIVRGFWLSNLN